ncbi:MAG: ParA family protein [Rhodomicrobium sp.]
MTIWTEIEAPAISPASLLVIAIGNLKGGVGKTVVSAYLSLALVERGLRVLAVDLDFQGSLSTALNKYKTGDDYDGIRHLLLGQSADNIFDPKIISPCSKKWENLTVVRANFDLTDLEDRLFAQLVLRQYETDPRVLLSTVFSDESLKQEFDLIILDTPPRLTIASINAFFACTHILIPTAPTELAMKGANGFISSLRMLKRYIGQDVNMLGVIPTLLFNKNSSFGPDKIGGVEVWKDTKIFRREDIANNFDLSTKTIAELFRPLAEKVESVIGLKQNGKRDNKRFPRVPGFSWRGLEKR